MNQCKEPCLKHCYNKNILLLIFISVMTGLLLGSFIFNPKKDNNSIIT